MKRTSELALPQVQISWTSEQLENLAKLMASEPAKPTDTLVRALRSLRRTQH